MTAANGKKNDHEDVLARLVRDLESKKTLCRVKDYAGVTLEQLNQHVKKHGPLVHPTLGEQPGFFVDEGRFVPFRMVVFGRSVIGPEIITVLKEWAKWSGHGGRVTMRKLTEAQRWTRGGEPFAPTCGASTFLTVCNWDGSLIQRTKSCTNTSDTPEEIVLFDALLDGGTVLPGFTLNCEDLDDVLDQESGSSSEEEVDFTCPAHGCTERFNRRGAYAAHAEWHRAESARARRRAHRANH
ncbi:hypothetical protein ON010_g4217 [Phytophthora cinnamomi]|nr:hypothetical protein ON010_g4217 [Phytophthora cinnamomi]